MGERDGRGYKEVRRESLVMIQLHFDGGNGHVSLYK